MNTIAPPRPTEARGLPVRLTAGPAAVAEARHQVHAAILAWDIPVDPDVAVLLTSDLVTDALRHETGPAITLTILSTGSRLRVDVHGTAGPRPGPPAGTGPGPGLILVANLSDEWGCYRTPAGQAAYFTLVFQVAL
jgi:hypothetical protein